MNTFLTKVTAYTFFSELILIYPVYALLFTESGISPSQIALLLIIWSATSFLLEVPTGFIADHFSRKNILLVSVVFKLIGYLIWLLFPTFWGFALGFVLWGIEGSLQSGTLEAYVYDTYTKLGMSQNYDKSWGILRGFEHLAVTLSLLLGGLSSDFLGYNSTLLLSMGSLLISFLFALLLPQAHKQNSTGEIKFFDHISTAVRMGYKDTRVYTAILFAVCISGIFGSFDEFIVLVLETYSISHTLIGGVLATIFGSFAIAGFTSRYFTKHIIPSSIVLSFLGGIFIASTTVTSSNPILSVLFFTFGAFCIANFEILLEIRLQKLIPSKHRATITSLKSLLLELMVLFITLLLGFVATTYSYSAVPLATGIVLSLTSILFMLTSKKS